MDEFFKVLYMKVSFNKVKVQVKEISNKIGDTLVNCGTELIVSEKASSGAGIVTGVIGAVIAISFMANALPSAYVSWTNATAAGNAMADASAGDKAVWNLGGLVMVGGSLMIMVGMFFKSNG